MAGQTGVHVMSRISEQSPSQRASRVSVNFKRSQVSDVPGLVSDGSEHSSGEEPEVGSVILGDAGEAASLVGGPSGDGPGL